LKVVLASRSPRRAELLAAAGIEFTIRAADVDETPLDGEAPRDYVLRLAEEKARAVQADRDEIVIAADTTVVLRSVIGSEIMGKPNDAGDAARMLRALAGRRHEVITAICLKRGDRIVLDSASTAVWLATLSDSEIADYVASGEPMDKAGAYAIQGLASRFIDRIDGSYSNVVGLPVALVYRHLRTCGYEPRSLISARRTYPFSGAEGLVLTPAIK
jgi:septum formation protein